MKIYCGRLNLFDHILKAHFSVVLFGISNDPLHSEKFHKLLQYFRMDRYKVGVTHSQEKD